MNSSGFLGSSGSLGSSGFLGSLGSLGPPGSLGSVVKVHSPLNETSALLNHPAFFIVVIVGNKNSPILNVHVVSIDT